MLDERLTDMIIMSVGKGPIRPRGTPGRVCRLFDRLWRRTRLTVLHAWFWLMWNVVQRRLAARGRKRWALMAGIGETPGYGCSRAELIGTIDGPADSWVWGEHRRSIKESITAEKLPPPDVGPLR